MVDNAKAKLASKKADWIVANDVSGDVMGGSHNRIHLVTGGGVEDWPEAAKEDVARHLISRIARGASVTIRIRLTRLPHGEGLPLPSYATHGAAGMDVVAAEDLDLMPGQRHAVATGFKVAIPEGYEIQVRPRSGLALKHGITVPNTPGTIDSDYRGELKVIMINHGERALPDPPRRTHRPAGPGRGDAGRMGRGRGAVRNGARRGRLRLDRRPWRSLTKNSTATRGTSSFPRSAARGS